MSETGDAELFSAPAAKESSEQSDEQFREQMKKAQQGMQNLKKEEGQVKAQDDNLAHIIMQFLGQSDNTDLFLLISRCVGQNIPSELIIAVLSLVDSRSAKEVSGFLEGGALETPASALVLSDGNHFNSLSPEQKKRIDDWVISINKVAIKRPQRSLDSLVTKKSDGDKVVREIAAVFVQLSAFILRNFFSSQNLSFEFQELHDFMQNAYVKLIAGLEEFVAEQKQIS